MPSQDSSSRDYDLLDRLVEEFNDRLRKGERPSVQEYCDRHPELADDLRDLLPAIAQVEQAKDGLEQAVEAAAAPALQHFGDFHILREVGHGGMGVVYEAEQVSLGRRVALKVLTERLMRDDKHKRRFEREARAVARLHHTNIVPVFGTGEAASVPYYVMQFIQGMGLDAVVEELARLSPGSGSLAHAPASPAAVRSMSARRVARSLLSGEFPGSADPEEGATQAEAAVQPPVPAPAVHVASDSGRLSDTSGTISSVALPGQNPSAGGKGSRVSYWQSVARIGTQVADALEYAHKQGVVHRDVKPSNLLLDLNGTVWVTDFGLAKSDGAENLTHTGDILGTLRYMPPEAFEGKAGARGDIYSLGLTLYELVALQPAFDQRDRNHLVKQVTTAEVAPLGTLRRGVPRDLETIVHKAIDRDPARRYQTAGELRDDLQRFVDDEPIQARRQSHLERYLRWARHHPAIAVLGAVLTAVLVLVTIGSLVVAGRMSALASSEAEAAAEERKARQEAEQGKEREGKLRAQAEQGKEREGKLRAQAEANFGKAQAAVNDYFTQVSESRLLQVPGLKALRKDLLLSALKFYQDFLKDRADDPTVRAGLAGAWLRVGKIRSELGEQKEAKVAYDQALSMYGELVAANPTDVEARHGLASCFSVLGQPAQAAAIWVKLVKPDDPRFQRELAQAYNALALSPVSAGKADRALAYHRKALAVRERLLAMSPNDVGYRGDLAVTLNNIAFVLQQQQRTAEALPLYRRAASHFEEAYRLRPADTVLAQGVAVANGNVAWSESALGNTDAAIAAFRRAVEVHRWIVRDNPAVETFGYQYVATIQMLAELLVKQKGRDEALRAIRETREVLENIRADSPGHLFNLAWVRVLHAETLKNGRADLSPVEQAEHLQAMDAAAAAVKRVVAADARYALAISQLPPFKALLERADVKNVVSKAAELALAQARNAMTPDGQKLAAAQRLLKEKEKLAGADPSNRRLRADRAAASQAVGLIQINLNELEEARVSLEKALALWQALAAEQPKDVQTRADLAVCRLALADIHWKSDRLAEWRRLSRLGVESLQETIRLAPSASRNKQLGAACIRLADRYAELGLWAESAAELRLALARVGYDTPHQGEDLFCDAGHLFLLAGDQTGYRKCASEGLRLRADTDNTFEAQQLLLLLSLSPDAPGDANQRDKLAAVATREGDNQLITSWGTLIRGASDYRAGKYTQAVDQFTKSSRSGYTYNRIIADSFRALALHRLGRLDEAKAALSGAGREIDAETRATAALGRLHDSHQWSSSLNQYRYAVTRPTKTPRVARRPTRTPVAVQQSPFVWSSCVNAYREASRVVLGKTEAYGPYLRLLRGRSYAQLGEKTLARAEFAAALAARPNDPDVLALRARIYTELGQKELAAADVAKRKELMDRILASPIENAETARRLADQLLAEADGPGTVLKPTRLKSNAGAMLTVQPDGSVLASGINPVKDVYTVEAEVEPGSFTHLCLEVLPHWSLPGNGPGRGTSGGFSLSEISLQAGPADGKGPATAVPFVRADDVNSAGNRVGQGSVGAAIDSKAETYWHSWNVSKAHNTAWFELVKPVGGSGRTRLTIRLEFQSPMPQASLGRFRLSLLKALPARLAVADLLKAVSRRPARAGAPSPWEYARLAAVLAATGRHSPAARVFVQAMEAEKTPEQLGNVREFVVGDAEGFAELIKLRPKDADLYITRAGLLARAGKQKEAKELTDKLLARPIKDAETAGRLADGLLALEDGPRTVLKPTQMKSEGRARLATQPDGSVLASGINPVKDVYTVETEVGPGSFTHLCLEALPHPTLPSKGPGRYGNGNFHLTEISLQAVAADGKGPAAAVPFVRASASYASEDSARMGGAQAAIDGKPETGWDVWPRVGQAHTAWFELAKPVGGTGRTRLTIRLEFQSPHVNHGLGRFRLSLLTAPPIRMTAAARLGAASLDSLNGYARLAVVLAATGRQSTAVKVIVQALEAEKTPEQLRAVREGAVHDAAVFAELVKLRPKDAELWVARARRLAQTGHDWSAAQQKGLALWQDQIKEKPTDAKLRTDLAAGQLSLADMHWKADRLAEWRRLSRQGVASLQEAVRLAPAGPLGKQLGSTHLSLADRYAELGLWVESAAQLRLALGRVDYDRSYQGEDLFLTAGRMFLLAEDQDGYSKCAKEGLRLRADTNHPVHAHRLLYLLSLSPDAPGNASQRDKLGAVATKGVTERSYAVWGFLSWGASDYRAGKYTQAVDRLRESLRKIPIGYEQTITRSFLALALHRLGRRDEAKAALSGSTREIDNQLRAEAVLGRIANPFERPHYLNPYREAVKVVLGKTEAYGPYLRLLRGRSYAHLGEKVLARAEFAAALAARPNDPDVLTLRAQIYTELGQKELAAADVAKKKELMDRLLAAPIENPKTAGRLADKLLAEADGPGTVLKPTRLKSEGGTTLTVQPDGSVLASGINPVKDVYTVETEVGPGSFTCLCLETLTHPSLPKQGPGRAPNGNFRLSEISLQAGPADGKGPAASVPFVRAAATFAQLSSANNRAGAAAAIDGKAETYWSVLGRSGEGQTGWFELARPVGRAGRTRLTIRVEFQTRFPRAGLGRFRLSLLTALPVRMAAPGLLGATSLDSFGGHARLAAVLAVTGRHSTAAARVFVQALEAEKTPEKLAAVRKAAVHDAAVFTELVKLRPKDAELWTARGQRLQAEGKKKEAEEAFAQAAKRTLKK